MKKTEKQKAREWLVNAGETEAVRLVKPSVCLSITFHRDQATLTFLTNNLLSLGLSSALTQQYLVLLSLKLLWRIYFTKDPYYLMSKGRCSMLQKIKKFSTVCRRFVRKTYCQGDILSWIFDRRFVRKTFCQHVFCETFCQEDILSVQFFCGRILHRQIVRKTNCQDPFWPYF